MTNLPEHPMLTPWREYAIASDKVVLRYADGAVVFEGQASIALLPELLSRLDGSRAVAELVGELGVAAEPAIRHALDLLHGHGLLIEGDRGSVDEPRARTARSLAELITGGLDLAELATLLAEARVAVVGDGGGAAQLRSVLGAMGVGEVVEVAELEAVDALAVLEPDRPANLRPIVVAPVSPNARALRDVNRWSLESGQDWTQVLPYDGSRALVGPTFRPGETGCYECFRLRRRSTLDFQAEAAEVDAAADVGKVHRSADWHSHAQDALLAGCAAQLLAWSLVPASYTVHPLLGRTFAIGWKMTGPAIDAHRLFRVPRCHACSPVAGSGVPQPWFTPVPGVAQAAEPVDVGLPS